MRQPAEPHPESDHHVVCPFCDTACDTTSTVAWCTGCGAEWSLQPDGDVVFDSARKADRQAVEEAARAAGGRGSTGLVGDARRKPVRLGKKRRG